MTPTNREARQWLKVQEDASRRKMQRERQAAVDAVLRNREAASFIGVKFSAEYGEILGARISAEKSPQQMRLV